MVEVLGARLIIADNLGIGLGTAIEASRFADSEALAVFDAQRSTVPSAKVNDAFAEMLESHGLPVERFTVLGESHGTIDVPTRYYALLKHLSSVTDTATLRHS